MKIACWCILVYIDIDHWLIGGIGLIAELVYANWTLVYTSVYIDIGVWLIGDSLITVLGHVFALRAL